ncbi:MurNAc alpha-1-phosphate uridylyltransferase [Rhizobium sp. RU35A]|uniref:Nucleotidyltransferase family protein n=1 Tax=Rhizobium straminoryzae TaxID=1387186 RepID=A0A549TAR0_9HYPH|nr:MULTISPECIES: nucleotidyltransferase family protein [Rhizobium]TRL38966.1 nucleotidyltransferase family protein [Rhizobium straminoryzae]SIR28968.1 MurNAc alpha-1-phosphate uridylyltransferase [Rhizobium sp. RU35A]
MTLENAMVLAAGLGTRLRPITDHMPKPLVPVGGRPMLDYILDLLAEAGIRTLAINLHHHADQMEAYLAARQDFRIHISDEREQLMNNGGGLARGLKLLPPGPVLVMNADLFWVNEPAGEASNLRRLISFYDPARMDMAMLCTDLDRAIGHDGKRDFDMAADGRLARYREGDAHPVVYAGAFVMDTAFMDDAPDTAFNLNIYFDKAIARSRLFGTDLRGRWITVGSPEGLAEAEAFLAAQAARA